MFGGFKRMLRRVGNSLGLGAPPPAPSRFNVPGRRQGRTDIPFIGHLSKKDRLLTVNEIGVKRKLGRSFFSKQVNPRLKSRRVRELTGDERAIARERGWI